MKNMKLQTMHEALRAWMPRHSGNLATLTADRLRLTVDDGLAVDLAFDANNATLWMSHSLGSPLAARDMLNPLGLLRRRDNNGTPFRAAYAMDASGREVVLCLPLNPIDMTPERFEAAVL
jgi:hypothetical protein